MIMIMIIIIIIINKYLKISYLNDMYIRVRARKRVFNCL